MSVFSSLNTRSIFLVMSQLPSLMSSVITCNNTKLTFMCKLFHFWCEEVCIFSKEPGVSFSPALRHHQAQVCSLQGWYHVCGVDGICISPHCVTGQDYIWYVTVCTYLALNVLNTHVAHHLHHAPFLYWDSVIVVCARVSLSDWTVWFVLCCPRLSDPFLVMLVQLWLKGFATPPCVCSFPRMYLWIIES